MDRQVPHTLKRRPRAEGDRLIDLGAFPGEPIELIGGELAWAHEEGARLRDVALLAQRAAGSGGRRSFQAVAAS